MKKTSKFSDYKVYVACSLTHATPEFRQSVEDFKKKLESHCTVLKFLGLVEIPPHEIYRYDIEDCVKKSHLVVAICDHPSIGLGFEMGTQIEARRMPCLAIAHKDSKVTDFIWDTRQPGYEFKRYKNLQKDGIKMVVEKLKKIHKANKVSKIKVKEKVKK